MSLYTDIYTLFALFIIFSFYTHTRFLGIFGITFSLRFAIVMEELEVNDGDVCSRF